MESNSDQLFRELSYVVSVTEFVYNLQLSAPYFWSLHQPEHRTTTRSHVYLLSVYSFGGLGFGVLICWGFFKASLKLTESILLELVIILKDLSRVSNIRVFFLSWQSEMLNPYCWRGCLNTVFPVYLHSKSAVSSLNFLVLTMEIVECHKGTVGLSGTLGFLFYE